MNTVVRRLVLLSIAVPVMLSGGSGTAFAQQSAWPAPNFDMLVTTEWLETHLRSRRVVLVDVAGSAAEYDAAHIPGAILLPIKELVTQCETAPNELPRVAELELLFRRLGVGERNRIVLYSRDEVLAARAWFTLDYLGHGSRAAVLDGGFTKWNTENRPVTTRTFFPKPAEFTARPKPEVVARIPAVIEISKQLTSDLLPLVALVDSRGPDEFLGIRESSGVPRAGHIPGAQNVFWRDNFTSGSPGVIRSVDELRALYAAAFITPDKRIVTYCRTGMQASVSYFALRYLGYRVHLYDASFTEWSGTKETEIEASGSRM